MKLRSTRRGYVTTAALAMGAGLVLATPASASAQTIITTMAVQPNLSSSNCAGGGSYVGSGSTTLSNGTFTTGFCAYPNHGIGTANDIYQKTGGSPTSIYFTWEFTDAYGGVSVNRQPLSGPFGVSAGQTVSAQGRYPSPGIQSTSGNAGCVRGVLIQGADTFTTRVVCY